MKLDRIVTVADGSRMEIRSIRRGEAEALRQIRLRALADSPDAFGARLADEATLAPEAWDERAAKGAMGTDDATFVAEGAGGLIGMVTARRDLDTRDRVGLYGLWVEPGARGAGVGRALTDAVLDWAGSRGARLVHLLVVAGNAHALAVYRRAGFAETGRTIPLPRDPSVMEIEMVRHLA
jgi:ribosomal protein S18 acetylase RimI-like enzyme